MHSTASFSLKSCGMPSASYFPLLLLIIAGLVGGAPIEEKLQTKYNVLFILADDLGFNDLGYVNPQIISPNIDALRASGVGIDNSYAQYLCTPSRAALMTGHYSWRTSLQHDVILSYQNKALPTQFKLLPQAMRENGYQTLLFGKWHLGHLAMEHAPMDRGFDYHAGYYSGQQGYRNHLPFGLPGTYELSYDFRDGWGVDYDALGQFGPDYLNEKVISMMQSGQINDTESPFFLVMSMQNPHTPIEPNEEDLARYGLTIQNATLKDRYNALVTNLDDNVGDLVATLKATGMYENTLIIFSSDNGAELGGGCSYPLRGFKRAGTLEGAVRVQSFVHGAMLTNTGVVLDEGIMHISDWYPTLVEGMLGNEANCSDSENSTTSALCGLDLDGVNQWESLLKGEALKRDSVVIDWRDGGQISAIRRGDFKLMFYEHQDGFDYYADCEHLSEEERMIEVEKSNHTFFLFNVREDPQELSDLADQYPDLVTSLRDELISYVAGKETVPLEGSTLQHGRPEHSDNLLKLGFGCAISDVTLSDFEVLI